eukprot:IDg10278t1
MSLRRLIELRIMPRLLSRESFSDSIALGPYRMPMQLLPTHYSPVHCFIDKVNVHIDVLSCHCEHNICSHLTSRAARAIAVYSALLYDCATVACSLLA